MFLRIYQLTLKTPTCALSKPVS